MSRPISASYLERKLRSIAGVLGANALPQLDDLQGLIVLENDRPEWARAGGEQPAAGGGRFGLVAGQTQVVQLRNPAESGMLAIVTRALVTIGGLGEIRAWEAFSVVDFATIFAPVNRDLRDLQSVGDSVACIVSGLQGIGAAGSGRQFFSADILGSSPLHLIGEKDEIMLPPGTAVMVDTTTVNVGLDVNYLWRERPLEGLWDLR